MRDREKSSESLWPLVTWLRLQFSNSACHPNASSSKFLSGLSEDASLIPSKTHIAIFTFLGPCTYLLSRNTLRSSETHLRTQWPAPYTDTIQASTSMRVQTRNRLSLRHVHADIPQATQKTHRSPFCSSLALPSP